VGTLGGVPPRPCCAPGPAAFVVARSARSPGVAALDPALRKLRLSGMAEHLEMRLLEAQKGDWPAIDLLSALVQDELTRRQDRLLDRALVFELAPGRFLERAEDAVFLGAPGTGKSHLAQAIGVAVIHQGHRVAYREVHVLLEELADAMLDGTRKEHLAEMATVPLLILDDLGMRKLPTTAAEDLLELTMRRYERASTLVTSNRTVDDWGRLLGDTAAVTAMLDRLLHHGHLLKCGPRSWRTRKTTGLQKEAAAR